jgi:hypothetical protein
LANYQMTLLSLHPNFHPVIRNRHPSERGGLVVRGRKFFKVPNRLRDPWTNICISIRIYDWLGVCIRSQVTNAKYRSGSEDLGRCWTGTGRNNGYVSVRGPKTHKDFSLLRPDAVLIPFYPHLYRFRFRSQPLRLQVLILSQYCS